MMRHSFFALLVAGIAALSSPRVSAQDETQFFKKPANAAEYWRAITFEINVGKYEVAADLIRQMVEYLGAAEKGDKELLDLEAKVTLVPFLRLRNVERWSRNDKVDAEARKNLEALIERISGALKRELSDPKRIARFVNALVGPEEEAAFAQKEIRRSGAAAIPVLASILKGKPEADLRGAIVDLLPKLDASTVPPLVAFLDISDPSLKFELLEALRRRPDYMSLQARVETNIIPHLWYLTSPGSKMPESLRSQAASMLAGQLQLDPEKRLPEAELTALADSLYLHKGTFADPNEVEVWRWDGDQLTMTPTNISAAEEYFGLRYLRWALALRPAFQPALTLFASLATDKAML
ncbi:MAG TPA: hypothetical protein VKD72_10850, partial [Gemmataceae bacterium]|nr:hypothetical protein [Gemmataceae bacterium]